jgi:hypothetical protein
MYNKERVKLIVGEWFDFKTGIVLSDETLSKLVDDITHTKQCDIPIVVKSFYCWDEDLGKKKCESICEACSQLKSNNKQ